MRGEKYGPKHQFSVPSSVIGNTLARFTSSFYLISMALRQNVELSISISSRTKIYILRGQLQIL